MSIDTTKMVQDIIDRHNTVVKTLQRSDLKGNLFRCMEVWHTIACEGADITHMARSVGINVQVNMQTGEISILPTSVRYYSTQRPVGPGTFPKPAGNRVLNVENFDERKMVESIGRRAWGYVEFERPLDESAAEAYELVKED